VDDAEARISLLMAWRRGAAVGAVWSLALVMTGPLGLLVPLVAFGTATGVMGGVEAALRRFLRECAARRDLGEISAVGR
jgi:hypothetical protein